MYSYNLTGFEFCCLTSIIIFFIVYVFFVGFIRRKRSTLSSEHTSDGKNEGKNEKKKKQQQFRKNKSSSKLSDEDGAKSSEQSVLSCDQNTAENEDVITEVPKKVNKVASGPNKVKKVKSSEQLKGRDAANKDAANKDAANKDAANKNAANKNAANKDESTTDTPQGNKEQAKKKNQANKDQPNENKPIKDQTNKEGSKVVRKNESSSKLSEKLDPTQVMDAARETVQREKTTSTGAGAENLTVPPNQSPSSLNKRTTTSPTGTGKKSPEPGVDGEKSTEKQKKKKGKESVIEKKDVQKDATPLQASRPKAEVSQGQGQTTESSSGKTSVDSTPRNAKGESVSVQQLKSKEVEIQSADAHLQLANIAACKELRRELADLNQKYMTLEKSSHADVTAKTQENEALRVRLFQTTEQHKIELAKLQAQLNRVAPTTSGPEGAKSQRASAGGGAEGVKSQGSSPASVNSISQLTEENKALKEQLLKIQHATSGGGDNVDKLRQQVKFLDDALKENSKLLNTSESNKKSLETKLRHSEDHAKKLETQLKEADSVHLKKVDDLSKELLKSETSLKEALSLKNTVNSKPANAAPMACTSQTTSQVQAQSDGSLQTIELEARTKFLEGKFLQLEHLLRDKNNEIQILKSKLEKNSELLTNGPQKRQIKKSICNDGEDWESEWKKAKESESQLQAEVEKYQNILLDTESLLNKLETSVEAEERNWHKTLHEKENQILEYVDRILDLEERLAQLHGKEIDIKSDQTFQNGMSPAIDHAKQRALKKGRTVINSES